MEFCVDVLEKALSRYGTPEIFNTDPGAQFTSHGFTKVLLDAGVRISMDGKGRRIDNVFIERAGRSLKYNEERPHQALARLTPNEVSAGGFPLPEAA